MQSAKPQTIHYRNAVYSGYLNISLPFSSTHHGAGILLLDDNTCVISKWMEDNLHPSLTVILHPNKFITYFLSEGIVRTVDPQTGICLYQHRSKSKKYIVLWEKRTFRVIFDENDQQQIEYLGQLSCEQIQERVKQQLDIRQFGHQSNLNEYNFFISKIKLALSIGQSIFHICEENDHEDEFHERQSQIVVVGVQFPHPFHQGNGINLIIRKEEQKFAVETIKMGKNEDFDWLSTCARITDNGKLNIVQRINQKTFSYEYGVDLPSKQVKEKVQKQKKFYHIKNNNFINKFYSIQLQYLQESLSLVNKIKKTYKVKQEPVGQQILEQGLLYHQRQTNIDDIKKQIVKASLLTLHKEEGKKVSIQLQDRETEKKQKREMDDDAITVKQQMGKGKTRRKFGSRKMVENEKQKEEQPELDYLTRLTFSYASIQEEVRNEKTIEGKKKFPYGVCSKALQLTNKEFKSRFS